MNHHRYVSHIDPHTWNDLTTIKNVMNTSFNKLIIEGARLVVKEKFESISQMKKRRNSMSDWGV